MHEDKVTEQPTDAQVEQVMKVIDAIWAALGNADGLPTPVVLKILGTVAADIIEQAGVEIIQIPVPDNTTMQ